MELTLLMTECCPNAAVLEERLAAALAGRPGMRIRRQVIADEGQAVRYGMSGSPTLLADGVDPFAAPGLVPALACRIYRDEDGRADAAPSAAALRRLVAEGGSG